MMSATGRSAAASACSAPARNARREPYGVSLDRDLAIEARVVGPVHLAHSPRAERIEHSIGTEAAAGREDHLEPIIGAGATGLAGSSNTRHAHRAGMWPTETP
jgi:hypothetical protein